MVRWPGHFITRVALLLIALALAPQSDGALARGERQPSSPAQDHETYLPLVVRHAGDTDVIPLCAEHDRSLYHPLFDEARNCHHDHEHKHDPQDVADIFGAAGAWFGGSSISYPWQTPSENDYKHQAYGYVTRRDLAANGRAQWVRALRVQGHVTNEPFRMADDSLGGGYLGDIHSYSAEAQVCRGDECGIVRFGGWLDYGCLQLFDENGMTYECLPGETQGPLDSGNRQVYPNGKSVWYGEGRLDGAGAEALFRITVAFGQADSAVWVSADDVRQPRYFCEDRQCAFNSSTLQQHVLRFTVPAWMDEDGDGYADFSGYTDQWGQIRDNCTAPGPQCVPLIVEHAPVGSYEHRDDEHGYEIDTLLEFDTSPAGSWWITGVN
ncbi:MAG: hypothetical protein ACOCXI_02580 [Chloroflexota bacterium]